MCRKGKNCREKKRADKQKLFYPFRKAGREWENKKESPPQATPDPTLKTLKTLSFSEWIRPQLDLLDN